jgi:hypothetical protein
MRILFVCVSLQPTEVRWNVIAFLVDGKAPSHRRRWEMQHLPAANAEGEVAKEKEVRGCLVHNL